MEGKAKSKSRRLIPLIARARVKPLKYYDVTGELILAFLTGRKVSAIVQKDLTARLVNRLRLKNGSRVPIIISSKNELLRLVEKGAIDFMASIGTATSKGVDWIVIDVKGTRKAWLSEYGSAAFEAFTNAARAVFEEVGLIKNAVIFDGMNGFKVMAYLNSDISLGDAIIFVKFIEDLVPRVVKYMPYCRNFLDDIRVSGNTVQKARMCRVPLSLHWSTKLSAIPVDSVYNFTSVKAYPDYVVNNLSTLARPLRQLLDRNPVEEFERLISSIREDYHGVLYEVKARVRDKLLKTHKGAESEPGE